MTVRPAKPYRQGVGIVLFNQMGRVFVGRRADQAIDAWQLPQGGIDEGEDPLAAARRELKEETGADKTELIGEVSEWLSYDLPPELAAQAWGGGYRGQRQKWFAFRFTGKDSDIRLDGHGGRQEFLEWKWLPLEQLPAQIVDFKRPLYERLVAEFRHLTTASR